MELTTIPKAAASEVASSNTESNFLFFDTENSNKLSSKDNLGVVTEVGGGGGGATSITFNRTYLDMQPSGAIIDTFTANLPIGKIPLAYKITNVTPFACAIDPSMTAVLRLLNGSGGNLSADNDLVLASSLSSGPVTDSLDVASATSDLIRARFTMSPGVLGAITLQITGAITLPNWRGGDSLTNNLDASTTADLLSITQTAPGVYDVVLTNVVEVATTWQDIFNGGGRLVDVNNGEDAPITAYSQAPGTPTTIDDLTGGEYSVEVFYL